jgi:hypothetical protein
MKKYLILVLFFTVAVCCRSLAASVESSCIDIHPQSIGMLTLGEKVPEAFSQQYKPIAVKGVDGWFNAKPFSYRVVRDKVTIIAFTSEDAKTCVNLNGRLLPKNLKLEDYVNNDNSCMKMPLAYGATSYQCKGYQVGLSSARSQWPNPYIRIEEKILK